MKITNKWTYGVAAIWVIAMTINCAVWGVGIYVAWHFISKYW